MEWLKNLWTTKPEAVFGGGIALLVAIIGVWATTPTLHDNLAQKPLPAFDYGPAGR